MIDVVERRYLAGFRFVDNVTMQPVSLPVTVTVPEAASIFLNRSGVYVMSSAASLEGHVTAFEAPPGTPALEKVTVNLRVDDQTGAFLPRWFSVKLPRDPDPEHKNKDKSLFHVLEIPLLPGPSYSAGGLWSGIRVSIGSGVLGRESVYVEVTDDDDGTVLGVGMSDSDGEAFIPLPGIRPLRHAAGHSGNVMTTITAATLKASWEPGRTWPPDPEKLAAEHANHIVATVPLELTSGKTERVKITLA